MTVARKHKVIEGAPGFYHCYSRCAQQQYLCGIDPLSEIDYSHRKEWIVERIKLSAQVFAIRIYAYAILSNHFHIVFYVDPEEVEQWSDQEVVDRWHEVYQWQRANPNSQPPVAEKVTERNLAKWRQRLSSVSWLMKTIKEPISRWANKERNKSGHFWDGRFGSTALVDDAAVVAGMAYVDLNPIRAMMAKSLEESDFTSIQLRLEDLVWGDGHQGVGAKDSQCATDATNSSEKPSIQPLFRNRLFPTEAQVVVTLEEYKAILELKINDDTVHSEKARQTVAEKLGCDPDSWLNVVDQLDRLFQVAVGAPNAVQQFFEKLGRKYVIDRTASQLLKRPKDPG